MNALAIPRPEYRALMLLDEIPDHCTSFMCKDDRSLPHVRPGEWVIADTTDRKPRHGELYLVKFGLRLDQMQIAMVRRRQKCGWVDQQHGPDGWTLGSLRNDECRAMLDKITARKRAGDIDHDQWVRLTFHANNLAGAWVEGPYQDAGPSYDHLCDCIVGTVIGLYQPQFEGPVREIKGAPND